MERGEILLMSQAKPMDFCPLCLGTSLSGEGTQRRDGHCNSYRSVWETRVQVDIMAALVAKTGGVP